MQRYGGCGPSSLQGIYHQEPANTIADRRVATTMDLFGDSAFNTWDQSQSGGH